MPKKDDMQKAVSLVRKVTKAKPFKGEDLLGSPELKRQLREAKKREAARRKAKKKK